MTGTRPVPRPVVAYQGEAGAFSEAAARQHFGDACDARGCASFEAAVREAAAGASWAVVIPVENARGGVVAGAGEAVALGEALGLERVGEVRLTVRHALIGFPGTVLAGVRTVRSHPQALAQCADWLAANVPAARVEAADDTAGSARELAVSGERTGAAIAHASAAARHGLAVLAADIQDAADNVTRFVVLARRA